MLHRCITLGLAVTASACVLSNDGESRFPLGGGETCQLLDFDSDATGAPIAVGASVRKAYTAMGIDIDAWRDDSLNDLGLPVAFDGADPGDHDDLRFPEQGNLLISQSCPTHQEIMTGMVSEPEPTQAGALLEFSLDPPRCVRSLRLFDLDQGDARIRLYDSASVKVVDQTVPRGGDGQRVDVTLQAHDCDVIRLIIEFDGTGAVDDVAVCNESCPGGIPPRTFFRDADGDGFGDPDDSVTGCVAPAGFVDNDDDCDDTDDAVGPVDFFADTDGDGYGDPAAPIPACNTAPGRVANDNDCDDTSDAINPGATEIIGNAIDENCDGLPL